MRKIINVLVSNSFQQFQMSINRPMFRFCVIAQPIIFGLLLGMMYLKKSPEDFMLYAVLGSGLSTFWSSICFSSASDINRERWYGTLENLFAAPVGFKWIVLGKILGNSLWGLISILISIAGRVRGGVAASHSSQNRTYGFPISGSSHFTFTVYLSLALR